MAQICMYCQKVGARTSWLDADIFVIGWAHKRCIPREKMRKKEKEKNEQKDITGNDSMSDV